jgi:CBS domain containing-hemolysin-like protein
MIELLAESRRAGALAPRAEELARNVLVLRHTNVADVMVPWGRVETLDLSLPEEALRERVLRSGFTRLLVLATDERGAKRVQGYVHQLDVLAEAGGTPLAERLRPLQELAPDLPLDRAVARLQRAGQRLALVGRAESPLGMVTLMDLLATIASDPGIRALSATARHG